MYILTILNLSIQCSELSFMQLFGVIWLYVLHIVIYRVYTKFQEFVMITSWVRWDSNWKLCYRKSFYRVYFIYWLEMQFSDIIYEFFYINRSIPVTIQVIHNSFMQLQQIRIVSLGVYCSLLFIRLYILSAYI